MANKTPNYAVALDNLGSFGGTVVTANKTQQITVGDEVAAIAPGSATTTPALIDIGALTTLGIVLIENLDAAIGLKVGFTAAGSPSHIESPQTIPPGAILPLFPPATDVYVEAASSTVAYNSTALSASA